MSGAARYALVASNAPKRMAGTAMMAGGASDLSDGGRAERFKALALPHLDDVYTLARYLLRSASDADDAVQECYLRAFRHFDTFRGGPVKPWLFAILRNVCRAEFARRTGAAGDPAELTEDALPLWQEPESSPETAIVLRDINDLSYREIAEVIGAPIGTVMSRLGRARSLLRAAWLNSEHEPQH